MKKTVGMFATLLVALFVAIQPAAAQGRGDWNRGGYDHNRDQHAYQNDFRRDRDWRANEYREDFRRERAFREREWRERERCDRFGNIYREPAPAFGFQYYGR